MTFTMMEKDLDMTKITVEEEVKICKNNTYIIGIIGKTLINYILIEYKCHIRNPDISGK